MNRLRSMLDSFDDVMYMIKDALRDRDARWILLVCAVVVMMLLRALGLAGLADLIGLIYIMYFVTFWRPQ